jgi:hypothetical protein
VLNALHASSESKTDRTARAAMSLEFQNSGEVVNPGSVRAVSSASRRHVPAISRRRSHGRRHCGPSRPSRYVTWRWEGIAGCRGAEVVRPWQVTSLPPSQRIASALGREHSPAQVVAVLMINESSGSSLRSPAISPSKCRAFPPGRHRHSEGSIRSSTSRRSASVSTLGKYLRRLINSPGPALGRGSGRNSATGVPSRVTTIRSPRSTRRSTSTPLLRSSRTVTVVTVTTVSPVRRSCRMIEKGCHAAGASAWGSPASVKGDALIDQAARCSHDVRGVQQTRGGRRVRR